MTFWTGITLASYAVGILTLPSVLLRRRGRPVASMSWMLGIFIFPWIGILLWWALGFDHLARRRRRRQRSTHEVVARLGPFAVPAPAPEISLLPWRVLPKMEAFGVFPPTSQNRVEVLVDAYANYREIEKAVREAKHYIHFLFYTWRNDRTGRRFRDLLIEKVKEGCEVRVLCDGWGSASAWGFKKFMAPLQKAGGRVSTFRPLGILSTRFPFNFRNHRKIVVVDGQVGFCGGLNIGDEYQKEWHDLGARFEGPVLDQLQEIFVEDWMYATGKDLIHPKYFGEWKNHQLAGADASCAVIASGPDMLLNATQEAFFMAINRAQERIWVMTPYFAPDAVILAALRSAVFRGVDVRLVLPAKSDVPLVRLAARSYYLLLLEAGVKIFEFEGAILHAKGLVFDQDLAVLGSANFDVRSFRLNFEASCFIGSKSVNRRMSEIFEADLKKSHEIKISDLEKQSLIQKVVEAAAHLMSPLF